jgi:signal transduction histidine kinase
MPSERPRLAALAQSPLVLGAAAAALSWPLLPRLPDRFGEVAFAALLGLGLGWAGFSCLRRARRERTLAAPWRWTGFSLLITAASNLLTGPLILLGRTPLLPTASARMWGATFGNSLEVLSRLLLLAACTAWPSERPGLLGRFQRGLGGLILSGALLFVLLTALPGLLDVFIRVGGPYGPVNLTFLLDLLSVVAALAVLVAASMDLPRDLAGSLRPLPAALLVYLGVLLVQNSLVLGLHNYRWDGPTAWPLLASAGFLAHAALAPQKGKGRKDILPAWIRPGLLAIPVGLALAWACWLLVDRPESLSPLARGIGLAVAGLVLLRLYLIQRELQVFNQSLERMVAERTRALEESVSAVLKTHRLNMVATLGAGLAHDFRNLLTVILGSSELMMLRAETGQPIPTCDIETIHEAAGRGRHLAQQLMALGRQSGPAAPVAFDLGREVEAFLPLLERMVPSSVKVMMAADPGPLPVRADPRQIEQILVNLVANARDAMPGGGSIRISAACVAEGSGPWIRLQVEDDGQGMEPSVLERIFEPFFTTKAPGLGTGLGLASVKGIVESWGGRLRAASTPGKGSVFTIDLRMASPDGP